MYEYLEHVLANYLNTSVGHTEDEAISILRRDLRNSPELAKDVMTDLEKAFGNRDYSLREMMAKYDVIYVDTEEEAHAYARKILGLTCYESSFFAHFLGKL